MKTIKRRMRQGFKSVSIEDRIADMKSKIEEEKKLHPDSFSSKTSLFIKKLLRFNRRVKSLTEEETTNYIEQLMNYAFYLKMESNKSQHIAKDEFEEILALRVNNSSAQYRLGFIYYKEEEWIKAINHFDTAIQLNGRSGILELSDDQLIKANQFISYCALKQAHESLNDATVLQEDIGKLTDYQGVSIEELSKRIKQQLMESEYVLVTNGVKEKVSKAMCEELIDCRKENHLFLYFSEGDIMLYGEHETKITKTYADYLKYLLERSSSTVPVKVDEFPLEFDTAMTDQETIKPGTVKTNISLLDNY